MKVLWITNTIFPDLSESLGNKLPVVGGWMYGLGSDISKRGIRLTVITSACNITEHHTTIKGIEYYILNRKKSVTEYDSTLELKWKILSEKIKPDIVHIHGTEYGHGLPLMKVCSNLKYVISIQGLVGVYSRFYLANIDRMDIYRNITIRDIIKRDNLFQAKKKFAKRGDRIENEYLRLATDIIGRTQWDHDHVKSINHNCRYHFCNESLRDIFYNFPKWDLRTKSDHTIFLSQAGYPIKGLHKILEAIYLIKKEYPNIRLRIAGDDITTMNTFMDKLRQGGYSKYISKIIKNFNLKENIKFLGPLDAENMAQEFRNCHVFVCPSSIENSPNSIGEAQLIGVPCIASYVGGVPNMITDRETGLLYRFEEVEMLAQRINEIFSNDQLAQKLSSSGIQSATTRHNRNNNVETTLEIYKNIITSN